jgi:hypothetical protein
VDNPKLTNQANPDALSPAPPASSPPEPLIRDRFLSGMNQVLTILRDLDCPLDVRVTMAHDVADAALRSMLASSPPERSEGWRPIETAPKDATAVLGYIPGRQGFFSRQDVAVVAWIETRWQSVNSGHWITSDVTHWMALPNPPALPLEPSNG